MILLVSGATKTVREQSVKCRANLGHLLRPGNGNSVASVVASGLPWAIDNGAYSGIDWNAFWKLLAKFQGAPGCLWVACPDVVGKAKETLGLFRDHYEEIALWRRYKIAFVGQDGQEDLPVPWGLLDCLFIGGTDKWKLSSAAAGLCQEAKRRGKWVHVGRVNSFRRIRCCQEMEADSIDGGSNSRWAATNMPKSLRWIRRAEAQPLLI